MQLGDENMSITLFEQEPVRRAWIDGRWLYSIIDVIAVLVPTTSNPGRYWSDLKRKLKDTEGFVQLYETIVKLEFRAPDGKMRPTETADVETLLRIIQSIPSPKAEPFKQWLAGLGAEVIDDDRTEDQRRLDLRRPKAETYKGLHAEIHQRGVRRPKEHAEFDVRGHKIFYDGATPRETEERRGIPPGEGPSWMGSEEMADNIFRDAQSRAYIKRMNIQGKEPVMEAHEDVSGAVRKFIVEDLGGTPPEQLPKARKSIEQAARDDQRRSTQGMDLWPDLDAPTSPQTIDAPKPDDDGLREDGQEEKGSA
jgi:hypothetical protein